MRKAFNDATREKLLDLLAPMALNLQACVMALETSEDMDFLVDFTMIVLGGGRDLHEAMDLVKSSLTASAAIEKAKGKL